jgi:ribosomal protein S18 acetylase RimI-like enzyme
MTVEGVAPSIAAAIVTDASPAALRAAIHADLVASALRRRALPGEVAVRSAALTAYRCDLPSVEVNLVAEARFGEGDAADAAIAEALAFFGGRPLLWWVGEEDTPADLGDRLNRRGVGFLDDIPGMAMDLADLAPVEEAPPPAGLTIEPVLDEAGTAAFHEVLVQGFPEDFAGEAVAREIAAGSVRTALETGYREPNGLPTRWIGIDDGRPVTTTRLHAGAGVAGIYAVVTAADARRRGYGAAITRHVLGAARDAGLRIATLQASTEGLGVYERIGFRVHRTYRLHEWHPPAG